MFRSYSDSDQHTHAEAQDTHEPLVWRTVQEVVRIRRELVQNQCLQRETVDIMDNPDPDHWHCHAIPTP